MHAVHDIGFSLEGLLYEQVHEVAGGDHGLKVHAGKESKNKTEQALHAVSEAVCQFVQKLKQEHLQKQEVPDASQQRADCQQEASTDKPSQTAKRKRKRTKWSQYAE